MEKMITFKKNNCDCDSVTLRQITIPLKGNISASYVPGAPRRVCTEVISESQQVTKSVQKGAF